MKKIALVLAIVLLACVAPRAARAQSTPLATVRAFYDAYKKSPNATGAGFLNTQKARLDPTLFALLAEIERHDPRKGDEVWLDFDPFINGQMNAATIRLGKQQTVGDAVVIPVYVSYRLPGHEQLATRVQVKRVGGAWTITNFLYPATQGMNTWDLKGWLQKELAR